MASRLGWLDVWASGASVGPSIDGGSGSDLLVGGTAADDIDGGDGDDTILGNSGNDRLVGGDGDDAINGGGGEDYMTCRASAIGMLQAASSAAGEAWATVRKTDVK